jgi:exodeoxyribonuclease VII small subunit
MTDPAPEPTFEESLAALEAIVHELEGGNLPLSDALARYEQAIGRLKHCYRVLETAERKIELLTGIDAAGQATTVPFEASDGSLSDKADRRSRRRTSEAGEDMI